MSAYHASSVHTQPFNDQQPGTSGLRRKVAIFKQPHYTHNFVQSIFDALGDDVTGATLVVGGDGRYFLLNAVDVIVKMAAANKVRRLIVGQRGILSTPAVSCMIRKHGAVGGIILTASHNPGGEHGDFGIKYNCANGGPAPSSLTDQIYNISKQISQYNIVENLQCDVSNIDHHVFSVDGREFIVDVVDSVEDYLQLMRDIFDFGALRTLLTGSDGHAPLCIRVDALNGVTGPYARRIFVDELGCDSSCVVNDTPLPDFGGLHPDPNLTYASALVDAVKSGGQGFGCAFDGDGDRNMILGEQACFVNPCDSLAVLAANLDCIPYFARLGVLGVARSMPTGGAVDRVAAARGFTCYEVPTGWKYFGNLMDAGRLSLCGEESFGTGSNHVREKDGVWAALAWLSVMARRRQSVAQILTAHWRQFGRNYFTRYDYEECASEPCARMMAHLEEFVSCAANVGAEFVSSAATGLRRYRLTSADNYSYTDPIDASVANKQGIRMLFDDGSRVVFRLSGTGSSGSTVRLYADNYQPTDVHLDTQTALAPLVDVALTISKLPEFTGRDKPTVIT